MAQYIMRLDDAAPHADWEKWERMESLLDEHGIKPLVGVIPDCKDPLINAFGKRADFWEKVRDWEEKGWTIAMHGYDHVYISKGAGFNPVNNDSEFAGVPLKVQKQKIRDAARIFEHYKIEPKVFYPPSHTMDRNTVKALKQESRIRIISDTIANAPYSKWGITFVPQQSGRVRRIPFKLVTFCYHPNVMDEPGWGLLEDFLIRNKRDFISFPVGLTDRKRSFYDLALRKIYFIRKMS